MRDWQEVAAAKQAERLSKIPKEWILTNPPGDGVHNVMDVPYTCGIMTEEELKITDKDCVELLQLIASKKLKSYDVTLAFCKRAAIAQQLINCLTEIFFEEGLARAKELDEILERTGKIIGPYHGLPFSIKEHYDVKGHDNCHGYVSLVGSVAHEDDYNVGILRKAGCVFYVKTNIPQTLMHLETNNNVWGRTLNPFNRRLTPGGSSGGESALVGFHGSPIGLAADGGGSIRVPAAFMGLYGLKPTSNRTSLGTAASLMPGCDTTPVALGPVCRSRRDDELFFKIMLAEKSWLIEPNLVPIPWRSVQVTSIKVGIFLDDGVCYPHPPIKRAIDEVTKMLSSVDYISVCEYKPYDHSRGYNIIRGLYYEDGGEMNKRHAAKSGEPLLPLSTWIMDPSHAKVRTVEEVWGMNVEREAYLKEYLAHWLKSDIDVVLCPVAPAAAFSHDQSKCWSYSAIWNLLDYPAIAFPTGLFCDAGKDPKYGSFWARNNEFDAWHMTNYDPELYEGAPIALQLVGKKWDDDKLMEALGLIERALGRA